MCFYWALRKGLEGAQLVYVVDGRGLYRSVNHPIQWQVLRCVSRAAEYASDT